jgi:hypothetical protein
VTSNNHAMLALAVDVGADDADLLLLAPAMQVGTADPAMQNADGVLIEAQGHGYVLELQHGIGGGASVVPLAVGSLAGFGLWTSGAVSSSMIGSAMIVGGAWWAGFFSVAVSMKCKVFSDTRPSLHWQKLPQNKYK